MKRLTVLMGVILLLVAASTSFGAVVLMNENRPLTLGVGDPPALFGAGGALFGMADPTQLKFDYFTPAMPGPTLAGAEFSLQFEVAGNKDVNQVSLYSFADPTKELVIFTGGNSPTTIRNVEFSWNGSAWNLISYNSGGTIDTETFATTAFGFVLQNTASGAKFYGDDEMNGGNAPQMLVFNSIGAAGAGFWFAFEDVPYSGADGDFNDLVFHGQSINPVPEPGTMMLLGSGLVGLASWGRKKLRK
jgi:hypothetical protein